MVQFREVGPLGVGLLAYLEADMPRITRWIEDRPTVHALVVALTLVGLVVALLLVSGCSVGGKDQPASEKATETPSLDHAGKLACDKFARWLADGSDKGTRSTIGFDVNDLAADSESGALADKAELLIKPAVYNSDENWALAADAFAYECDVLGWKP